MRISDWSSDVCSSDLTSQPRPTVTADTLGASFVSETLVPLLNDTAMTAPYGLKRGWPSRLQSKTAIGRYRLADAHAIVAGERAEAALEALADSAEFPFGAVAIDFAEDHRGFGRSVFREVIAHDFGAGLVVDRTDEGVRDLAEALAALFTFVDRDGDRHLVDFGGDLRENDLDLFVVEIGRAHV